MKKHSTARGVSALDGFFDISLQTVMAGNAAMALVTSRTSACGHERNLEPAGMGLVVMQRAPEVGSDAVGGSRTSF